MSEFRKIVENILRKNEIKKFMKRLRQEVTPEYIYHIFHLDEDLKEDKSETKNLLWLAQQIYNQILDKIDNKKYKKTKFGGIVTLDNPDIEIEFNITGRMGDGFFSKEDNRIIVYVDDIKNLKDNDILENALIHEIVHSISYDDFNNYYNYIKPENNRDNYLTQPLEFEANKVSLCNYIVKKVLKTLKSEVSMEEIKDFDLLRKCIDKILSDISLDEYHFYWEFLKAVHQDKKAFEEMYFEIIETCVEFIQEHLTESHNWALTNKWLHEDIHNLPNLTQQEAVEKIYKNLDEAEKSKYYTEKDCAKEFKEGYIKIENKKS